jgi:hypothetical protein
MRFSIDICRASAFAEMIGQTTANLWQIAHNGDKRQKEAELITAVEANTERPTDSIILVRLIARVCTAGGHLHRLDLRDMNPIGLLEQQEELRRLSQQIHFLSAKARGEAKSKNWYFQLIRRVRRLRKRLLRDLETVRRKLESRADLPPSRRLMGEEALCLIADDLAS